MAHSIILASCSEMMRSWLSRWSEEHPREEQEQGEPHTQPDRRRRRLALLLDLDLGPGELAAGEAVVRFMYTQTLEAVEDDEELLACMLLADRWLLPDCVAACAARLQSTPAGSLSWRVRAALLGLPRGLSAASPHVAQLQARAEGSIMRTFRCPELVLDDSDHLHLLLSLPADRLEQLLLARQDVQVTSENVVLVLLSAWLQHNCPHPHLHPGQAASSSNSGSDISGSSTSGAGDWAPCGDGRCCSCSDGPSNGRSGSASEAEEALPAAAGGSEGDSPEGVAVLGGGGGGGGGGVGPPEVESLLRLVRYDQLTPHYRTTVAPSLPGLRELRLHHMLLAEASAAAAAAAAAASAAADAGGAELATADTAPAAVAAAPAAAATVAPAEAAAAAADAYASACCSTSTSTSTFTSTCTCISGGERCSSGPGSGGDAACDSPIEAPTAGLAQQAAAAHPSQPQPARSEPACMSDAGSAALSRSVSGASGVLILAALTSGDVSGNVNVNKGPRCCSSCGEVVEAAGPLAACAADVPAPPAPPRLPRRLPYSTSRRIEWTRDIRDVRLHLTGVGGPQLGGEAAVSPPVFLGGYCWHLATRFVTASAAAADGARTAAAAAAAAVAGAAATPAAGAAAVPGAGWSASAGRLQLQLGVVCTAPWGAGDDNDNDDPFGDDEEASLSRQQASPGAARGSGFSGFSGFGAGSSSSSCAPLSIASCTVGVVDVSGRPAWQLVQTPCVLLPPPPPSPSPSIVLPPPAAAGVVGAGSGGAAGAEVGWVAQQPQPQQGRRRRGGGGSRGGRWEVWSGLSGLEPSWWESGSALTVGGVLRLYCTLTLQG
ncbi:hypothetical protein PLESTB_000411400 [Pleodorina starrii]|uniref:BTB domain-containing protein n=1 Tax=Pleodorina starrii TaxID=330485 RepID=A0A9W6EZK9_9CHLO|nr:hypothetical protein PLESTB_000411400 [Pleodorina starrii]GLC70281.1 hypothetical protein PLESTF_000954800 [Pleodorina starrii]